MMNLNFQMVLILFQNTILFKNHKTLTTVPPIRVYINRTNNSSFSTI